jgi:N-acetylglucosaminyl-diphospho-decaprenol L-rhamnosyltransferase
MAAPPEVAVAIVNWNTRELLARCLRSLQPEVDAGRSEVWVVDNASADGSAELVRAEFPWVRLIASDENLGFGRAVNLVARQNESNWIALANADVALRPGALERLLQAGADDPGAGALAPRLVLPDGSTQHSVFAFPSVTLALLIATGIGGALFAKRLLLPGTLEPAPRRVPWAVAAFLLVRRAAWDTAGEFDEQQWMYAEDLDLGWRLRRAGWFTRWEPGAEVDHESGASTGQVFGDAGQTERWQRASYAWMLRRLGTPRTRAIAVLLMAGQAVRWGLLALATRVAPGRYRPRRDAARWWMELHRAGLASRAALEAGR